MQDDRLKIFQINSMELYPDEFLDIARNDVEKEGRNVIMIDSIKGYEITMEEFGLLITNLQNFIHYLNRKNCTTILINEIEEIAGTVRITERGISYLFDNAILLRYAELNSKIIKVIGIIKKRLGDFKSDLREFQITKEGIRISDKIEGFEEILSGLPKKRK